jgi:hypothetical protein
VLFTWQQRFESLALGFESSRSPTKLEKDSNLRIPIRGFVSPLLKRHKTGNRTKRNENVFINVLRSRRSLSWRTTRRARTVCVQRSRTRWVGSSRCGRTFPERRQGTWHLLFHPYRSTPTGRQMRKMQSPGAQDGELPFKYVDVPGLECKERGSTLSIHVSYVTVFIIS